jgi:hypothetical protein
MSGSLRRPGSEALLPRCRAASSEAPTRGWRRPVGA